MVFSMEILHLGIEFLEKKKLLNSEAYLWEESYRVHQWQVQNPTPRKE